MPLPHDFPPASTPLRPQLQVAAGVWRVWGPLQTAVSSIIVPLCENGWGASVVWKSQARSVDFCLQLFELGLNLTFIKSENIFKTRVSLVDGGMWGFSGGVRPAASGHCRLVLAGGQAS